MSKLAVVALGGNALQRDNQRGTIEEQEKNTFRTLENLVFLLSDGYELVITHGNGPQVGDLLQRNDAGELTYGIPQMPLDVCVAGTQGEIGYMIERILHDVLHKHGIRKNVVTLVSQVIVDRIAEFITHDQARRYLEAGMFGEGTMASKMEAALYFIEHGGSKSVITEATKLENRKYGSRITMN